MSDVPDTVEPVAAPDIGTPYRRAYAGRRIGNDASLCWAWVDVDDFGVPLPGATERWFGAAKDKKGGMALLQRLAPVGGVYVFTPTKDGSAYYTSGEYGPRYVSKVSGGLSSNHLGGESPVLGWVAKDRAAEVVIDREKRREKAKEEASLVVLLAPIREAYRTTNARGKRALLAAVLEALAVGGAS